MRAVARQPHEELPQLVHGHVGRVDDLVGHLPDRCQPRPLVADALARRSIRRERMGPPRLAEPPDERRVAGLEENEHGVQPPHPSQPAEDPGERRQEVPLADVDDDRHFAQIPADGKPCQRRNERRRQVVDAEVTEILERADGLRLAGSGEARQHDERRARQRRGRGVGCTAP